MVFVIFVIPSLVVDSAVQLYRTYDPRGHCISFCIAIPWIVGGRPERLDFVALVCKYPNVVDTRPHLLTIGRATLDFAELANWYRVPMSADAVVNVPLLLHYHRWVRFQIDSAETIDPMVWFFVQLNRVDGGWHSFQTEFIQQAKLLQALNLK